MKNENITKKLQLITCKDESRPHHKSMSQIHTNPTIQLASDGYRAAIHFNNNKARDYKYEDLSLTDTLANSISTSVIKNFNYSSFIYINRKQIKQILSTQLDNVKSQYKGMYNYRHDQLITTTKLYLDVSTKLISLSTECLLTKFNTKYDSSIKYKNIDVVQKLTFKSENENLPVKIEIPYQLNHNLELTFTSSYLLDLINFHTEDQLDIMMYDSNVTPIMSIQNDRLMLLLPTYPSKPKIENDD